MNENLSCGGNNYEDGGEEGTRWNIGENTGRITSEGIVYKKSTGSYFVRASGGTGDIVLCSISNKLRKVLVYPHADPSSRRPTVDKVEEIREVDPVAIGDRMVFVESAQGEGMITEVYERRNKLSRLAAGPRPIEQVIVANIDQVIAVFAARNPTPKWNMLDRYIADCESAELPVVICITKMDLVDEEFRGETELYENIGYCVVHTSTATGAGIEELKEILEGKVSVFVGKSGVGKTTLLNAIEPGLGLKVNEVSGSTGKGKHTTSHYEMFDLGFGGSVVDTPGMREFGLWSADTVDVAYLFREMREYIGSCKFGNSCTHTHEPGCTIKEAVEAGEIDERRYTSYVKMAGT